MVGAVRIPTRLGGGDAIPVENGLAMAGPGGKLRTLAEASKETN